MRDNVFRTTTGATVLAALALAVSACSGSSETASVPDDCEAKYTFATLEQGKLKIATNDAPPYYIASGGQPTGIDKEILDRFAEDTCLQPEWQVFPSAAVIESVNSGRADIAAGGWYATEERGKIVGQSDPVYVELPTLVAKQRVSNINELKGKTVGTITGYTWVDEAKNVFGDKLKLYQSADAVLADIRSGRIDAGLVGGIDAPYLIKESGDDLVSATMDPDPQITSSVTPSLPNYPHAKSNPELTAAINGELAELHSDGFIAGVLEEYGLDPALADVDKYK